MHFIIICFIRLAHNVLLEHLGVRSTKGREQEGGRGVGRGKKGAGFSSTPCQKMTFLLSSNPSAE